MSEATYYLIIFIVAAATCFITCAIVEMWHDLPKVLRAMYIFIVTCFVIVMIIITVAFLSPHKKYEVTGHFTCKMDYYALYLKDRDDTIMIEVDKEDYYKYKKGDYYEFEK